MERKDGEERWRVKMKRKDGGEIAWERDHVSHVPEIRRDELLFIEDTIVLPWFDRFSDYLAQVSVVFACSLPG